MRATLLLEDGSIFHGRGFGAKVSCVGEVVFNTAMSGYEEVISDPSYRGQIVLFTTSHLGNTGVTTADLESTGMEAQALICKEFSSACYDNHRAKMSLEEFLVASGKCAISDLDTRALTRKLRSQGCMMGVVSTAEHDPELLSKLLAQAPRIEQTNLAQARHSPGLVLRPLHSPPRFKMAVIDFGIKKGILDALLQEGIECHLFGSDVCEADLLAIQADGLFLGNGPGDPHTLAASTGLCDLIRSSAARGLPVCGICMGHQLIALAFGGVVRKLAFGHHAVNHPVLVNGGRKAFITSQNHNYCVEVESVKEHFQVTHVHLNDGTCSGLRHRTLPVMSVQFHPESNPGPHDARQVFSSFVALMEASHV